MTGRRAHPPARPFFFPLSPFAFPYGWRPCHERRQWKRGYRCGYRSSRPRVLVELLFPSPFLSFLFSPSLTRREGGGWALCADRPMASGCRLTLHRVRGVGASSPFFLFPFFFLLSVSVHVSEGGAGRRRPGGARHCWRSGGTATPVDVFFLFFFFSCVSFVVFGLATMARSSLATDGTRRTFPKAKTLHRCFGLGLTTYLLSLFVLP